MGYPQLYGGLPDKVGSSTTSSHQNYTRKTDAEETSAVFLYPRRASNFQSGSLFFKSFCRKMVCLCGTPTARGGPDRTSEIHSPMPTSSRRHASLNAPLNSLLDCQPAFERFTLK